MKYAGFQKRLCKIGLTLGRSPLQSFGARGDKMIDIVSEPRGKMYLALLQVAKKHCASFSLVWRDEFRFGESARNLERSLQPFLIREEHTDEWPGTRLLGNKAQVRHYRVTDESLSLLGEVEGLYSWRAPDFPEDLAFYAADGSCWLLSISRENDAAIMSESITAEEIKEAVSSLALQSRKH